MNILIYGDSNTRGQKPSFETYLANSKLCYYDSKDCWWYSLIGGNHLYINGLCGRSINHDNLYMSNSNATKTIYNDLIDIDDIDLVCVQLGTNDCKKKYNKSAVEIAESMENLCSVFKKRYGESCNIMLISPAEINEDVAPYYKGAREKTKQLDKYYRKIAERNGYFFVSGLDLEVGFDGEHLSQNGHKQLSERVLSAYITSKMSAIACVGRNWEIGCANQLLFKVPGDLKRFRELTTDNVCIMGYNTFLSLPHQKPLPNRVNIVLTRKHIQIPNAIICHNKQELFKTLGSYHDKDIYVIGGQQVYKELLPYCRKSLITMINVGVELVNKNGEKDIVTYFPNLDKLSNWQPYYHGDEINNVKFIGDSTVKIPDSENGGEITVKARFVEYVNNLVQTDLGDSVVSILDNSLNKEREIVQNTPKSF